MVNFRSTIKSLVRLLAITFAAYPSGQAAAFSCQGADGQVAYQENPCNKSDSVQRPASNVEKTTGAGIDEIKEGVAAFEKKDFVNAASILVPLAEKNKPEAQYYVSQMYLWGFGVPKDSVKALQLMQASADSGFEQAQLGIVGFMWVLFGYNIGDIRLKIPDAVIRAEIWKRSKTAFLMKPCEGGLIHLVQQFVDANEGYAQEWEKLMHENSGCLKCGFPCIK